MKNKKSIAILMAAITLASCQSYKKVPYLQSYKSLTDKSYKEIVINEVNQQDTLYDAHIQPKDLLTAAFPRRGTDAQRGTHSHPPRTGNRRPGSLLRPVGIKAKAAAQRLCGGFFCLTI